VQRSGGVFYGGDLLTSRLGGGDRKDATGDQQSRSALAIVLGTALDGIPESMVIDLRRRRGGAAYLAAVFISNLPEALSSTTGLARGGWKNSRILDVDRDRFCLRDRFPGRVWAVPGLLTRDRRLHPGVRGRCDHHHAGRHDDARGFEHGGKLAGVVTTLGFAVAYGIHTLD